MSGQTNVVSSPRVLSPAVGRAPGDGAELAFGLWPGRGKPVIAIPGLTANYMGFAGIGEQIAGRRPLLAFDLRGRGDSDAPDGPGGMDQHARDVATAMRAFGLGPSVVMGWSMGGPVSLALAEVAPDLVAGIVLIDAGIPAMPRLLRTWISRRAWISRRMMNAVMKPALARLRETFGSREAHLDSWRRGPFFRPDQWNPWVEAFLNYGLGGEPPALRWKCTEAAARADIADSVHMDVLERRFGALKVPLLLVRAEHGLATGKRPAFPKQAVEKMRQLAPDLEDHLVPGSTHLTIGMCEPGATVVADLTVDFARRCDV